MRLGRSFVRARNCDTPLFLTADSPLLPQVGITSVINDLIAVVRTPFLVPSTYSLLIRLSTIAINIPWTAVSSGGQGHRDHGESAGGRHVRGDRASVNRY